MATHWSACPATLAERRCPGVSADTQRAVRQRWAPVDLRWRYHGHRHEPGNGGRRPGQCRRPRDRQALGALCAPARLPIAVQSGADSAVACRCTLRSSDRLDAREPHAAAGRAAPGRESGDVRAYLLRRFTKVRARRPRISSRRCGWTRHATRSRPACPLKEIAARTGYPTGALAVQKPSSGASAWTPLLFRANCIAARKAASRPDGKMNYAQDPASQGVLAS